MKKRFLLIGVALLLAVAIIPAAAFTQIQQPVGVTITVDDLGSSPTLNIVDNNGGSTDAADIGYIDTTAANCDEYIIDFTEVPLIISRQQVMVIGGPTSGYDASEQNNYSCSDLSATYGPYAGITYTWSNIDHIFMLQNNHPDQQLKLWLIMEPSSALPPAGMEIEIWAVQKALAYPFRLFKIDQNGVIGNWSPSGPSLDCTLCSATEDISGNNGGYSLIGKNSNNEELKCWMVVKTDGTCDLDDYTASWKLIANTFD